MKIRLILFAFALVVLGVGPVAAQTPMLSSIDAPYANLQGPVHMAGIQFGPGAAAYGPVGTPLQLAGTSFGASGTVNFPGSTRGSIISVTPSLWTSTTLFVTVPAGATTGLVTVTAEGKTSNGLPFIVMPGAYSGSCPTYRPSNQLEVTTDSLPNGQVNNSYSTLLNASGGTGPYTWSISGNSLPSGLTLSSSQGTISGTPTAAEGPVALTITATDQRGNSDQVVLNLTIDPQALTAATIYSYTVPTSGGYDGVGNILQYQDSVNGTWNFGFDTLNRLTSAVPGSGASGAYTGQNFCMAYDAFGNRTANTMQSSACPTQETNLQPTMPYTTSNQFNSGSYGYDASGDLNAEPGYSYLYDGEGRVCAVESTLVPGMTQMTGYIYDGSGARVAKGTLSTFSCDLSQNGFQPTEQYILGPSGEELTMLDGSGNWQMTNIYGGGELLATMDQMPNPAYPGTQGAPQMIPALHYHVTDPLGTRRVKADTQGVPEEDCQNLPFGDGLNCFADPNGNGDADNSPPLHFTGKERDAETGEANGNDYFGARYFASGLGRFMTPDWSAKYDPVPYAKLDNPQTLNLYAYVQNNPLTMHDPDGHDDAGDGGGGASEGNEESFDQQFAEGMAKACADGATFVCGEGAGTPLPAAATPQTQNGAQIQQLTNAQDNAMSDPDFQPGAHGHPSHCSEATCQIANAVGANTEPLGPRKGKSFLANDQVNNLNKAAETPGTGWHKTDLASAQGLANQGFLVIIGWINPTGGSGHTVTVMADPNNRRAATNPTVAQVGGSTGNGRMGFRNAFGSDKRGQVQVFVYNGR